MFKNFLPKILFYYGAVASFFITVNLLFASKSTIPMIFAILFLPVTAYFIIEFFKQIRSLFSKKKVEGSDLVIAPKKGEIVIFIIFFLILTGFSFKNIYTAINTPVNPEGVAKDSSSPLIFKVTPSPTPKAYPKLTISITDGSPSINIRKGPSIYTDKIGEAKEGDIFSYVEKANGWYQIVLPSGIDGFISIKYAKEVAK